MDTEEQKIFDACEALATTFLDRTYPNMEILHEADMAVQISEATDKLLHIASVAIEDFEPEGVISKEHVAKATHFLNEFYADQMGDSHMYNWYDDTLNLLLKLSYSHATLDKDGEAFSFLEVLKKGAETIQRNSHNKS